MARNWAVTTAKPINYMQEKVDDKTVEVDQQNSVLSSMLDKYAPLNECVVTLRPVATWYDDMRSRCKMLV